MLSVPSKSQTQPRQTSPDSDAPRGGQAQSKPLPGPPLCKHTVQGRLRGGRELGKGLGLSPEQGLRVGGLAAESCPAPLPSPSSQVGAQCTTPPPTHAHEEPPKGLCVQLSPPSPPAPLARPSLPPSGTRRGRNWAGNRPLTATWGPCQVSLPLAPSACPLTALSKETKDLGGGGGKALKGTGHAPGRTPGRGLGLGPERPPG